jgi:hypothetical protein
MKKILVLTGGLLLAAAAARAGTGQVNMGVSIADGKPRSFYLSVGDYYRVPEAQVRTVKGRYRLHDEELPVVFFLAARARVEPSAILSLRAGGMSWLGISVHFRLTPDIFFVPVTMERIGPPYGHAYGYFKKYRPTREWKKIVLTDAEVVDLVNLRFISESHGISPEAVIGMRAQGKAFVSINDEIGRGRAKGNGQPGKAVAKDKGKHKGGQK